RRLRDGDVELHLRRRSVVNVAILIRSQRTQARRDHRYRAAGDRARRGGQAAVNDWLQRAATVRRYREGSAGRIHGRRRCRDEIRDRLVREEVRIDGAIDSEVNRRRIRAAACASGPFGEGGVCIRIR
ncbi:MAG: hypothetical protein ABJA60_06180, partial [Nitrosospira sp.]